jgi:hypothetical protein
MVLIVVSEHLDIGERDMACRRDVQVQKKTPEGVALRRSFVA